METNHPGWRVWECAADHPRIKFESHYQTDCPLCALLNVVFNVGVTIVWSANHSFVKRTLFNRESSTVCETPNGQPSSAMPSTEPTEPQDG